jgi:PEP-CTERM motif
MEDEKMKIMKFGMLGVCVALIGASDAMAAVGSFTLRQTDYSTLGGGTNSWLTGVYNSTGGGQSAFENRDDSSAASVRNLGPDGVTAADFAAGGATTRKTIAVSKWDLSSIVGPGETISSITLSFSNKGGNTGALFDVLAANEGSATDIEGATLEEPDIYAGTWAGYSYAGPTPPGGAIPDSPVDPNGFVDFYDSTIPLNAGQFTLLAQVPGTNVATAGVIYTQVITDGALLAAANADLNGSLMIAIINNVNNGKVIDIARGNVNSAARLDVTVVPEPASLALLGLGGLTVFSRRRK